MELRPLGDPDAGPLVPTETSTNPIGTGVRVLHEAVKGAVFLEIMVGGELRRAEVTGHTARDGYEFAYTVQADDAGRVQVPAGALEIDEGLFYGGSFRRSAEPVHGAYGPFAGHVVVRPPAAPPAHVADISVVSRPGPNGYASGDTVEVEVRFSGVVTVTAASTIDVINGVDTETERPPILELRLDESYVDAKLKTEPGKHEVLLFSYDIEDDTDESHDGLRIVANGLRPGTWLFENHFGDPVDVAHRAYGPFVAHTVQFAPLRSAVQLEDISVVSRPGPGGYRTGDTVELAVRFSEEVTVTEGSGSSPIRPTLNLRFGDDGVNAELKTEAGTHEVLVFSHLVRSEDSAPAGVAVRNDALEIGNWSFVDSGGIEFSVFHPAFGPFPEHKVNAPTPSPVGSPEIRIVSQAPARAPDLGFYRARPGKDAIVFEAAFDLRVSWSGGAPELAVLVGEAGSEREHVLPAQASSNGEAGLRFIYRVQPQDSDPDGVRVEADSLRLPAGATLEDGFDRAVPLSHRGWEFPLHPIAPPGRARVESIEVVSAPGPAGYYASGDRIVFEAAFSEAVRLSDHALFLNFLVGEAESGEAERVEIVTDPDAADPDAMEERRFHRRLRFAYLVTRHDRDPDGIRIPANALEMPAGVTLRDRFGRNVVRAVDADAGGGRVLASEPSGPLARHAVNAPVPASVVGVEAVGPEKEYSAGLASDALRLRVTMSREVTAAGEVWLGVQVGEALRRARLVGGGGQVLEFVHDVQWSDTDADGVSVPAGALALGEGGSVRDAEGRAAMLAHGAYGPFAGYTVAPRAGPPASVSEIGIVSRPGARGGYRAGERIEVEVRFSGAIVPRGGVTVALEVGAELRTAALDEAVLASFGVEEVTELHFFYEVNDRDVDADGVSVPAGALGVAEGPVLRDASGQRVVLAHGAYGPFGEHTVNVVESRVAEISVVSEPESEEPYEGYYRAGEDALEFEVRFEKGAPKRSEGVTLGVVVGGSGSEVLHAVEAVSGGGTPALRFRYAVREGDSDPDGVRVASDSLRVRAGSAVVVVEHEGYGPFAAHRIEPAPVGVAAIAVVSAPGPDGYYEPGEDIVFEARFTEEVRLDEDELFLNFLVGDRETGEAGRREVVVDASVGDEARFHRRLRFRYAVREGDTDSDGVRVPANGLEMAEEGRLRDRFGRDVDLEHEGYGPLSLHYVRMLPPEPPEIVAMAPVSSPGAAGYYASGERVEIAVTFSYPVTVQGGGAALELEVGEALRSASYVSGSGSGTLVFAYEVAAGDADADGVEVPAGSLALPAGTALSDHYGRGGAGRGAREVRSVRAALGERVAAAAGDRGDGGGVVARAGRALRAGRDGGDCGDLRRRGDGERRRAPGAHRRRGAARGRLCQGERGGDAGVRVAGVGAGPRPRRGVGAGGFARARGRGGGARPLRAGRLARARRVRCVRRSLGELRAGAAGAAARAVGVGPARGNGAADVAGAGGRRRRAGGALQVPLRGAPDVRYESDGRGSREARRVQLVELERGAGVAGDEHGAGGAVAGPGGVLAGAGGEPEGRGPGVGGGVHGGLRSGAGGAAGAHRPACDVERCGPCGPCVERPARQRRLAAVGLPGGGFDRRGGALERCRGEHRDPARAWSDKGVSGIAGRLYRVSAVNTGYGAGNPSNEARVAPRAAGAPALEVDTDGDGVPEADPTVELPLGGAVQYRVRPGPCQGRVGFAEVGVHGVGDAPAEVASETSMQGFVRLCAGPDAPGRWMTVTLSAPYDAAVTRATPFDAWVLYTVRHDVDLEGPRAPVTVLDRGRLLSARVVGPVSGRPGAPRELRAEAEGASAIRLAWRAPAWRGTGIEGYGIEVSEDEGRSWATLVDDSAGTATVHVDEGLAPGSRRFYRVRARDGSGAGEWSRWAGASTAPAAGGTEVVTARFEGVPRRHGGAQGEPFALRIVFSEAVALDAQRFREGALSVSGAQLAGAWPVEGEPGVWEVRVRPGSHAPVRVSVAGGRACAQAGAVCTAEGKRLSPGVTAVVPGPGGVGLLHHFVLVDVAANAPVAVLEDGAVVVLEDLARAYAVEAVSAPQVGLGSVHLALGGTREVSRTDNAAPWSLYGGVDGALVGEALAAGSYTLEASAYAQDDRGGALLHRRRVAFTVSPNDEAGAVLSGFVVVDAESGAELAAVVEGATVWLADPAGGSYGIRAEPASGAAAGSVRLALAGGAPEDEDGERVEAVRTVDGAPYSLYGDSDGRELGAALPEGAYTVRATAYAEAGGAGAVLGSLSVRFTVARAVLAGFVLVDATAHADAGAVAEGARLTELDPAKAYGFRAEAAADGGVESVTLHLSGSALEKDVERTESWAPYSLYGDSGGNEHGAALPVGPYRLAATAWSGKDGKGEALQTLSVSFAVGEAQPVEAPEPLTAAFDQVPVSHAGSGTFTLRVVFSEPVAIEAAAFAAHGLIVGNATVTGAARIEGAPGTWEVTVAPVSHAAVTVALAADRACGEEGALCTADGRGLDAAVPERLVPGPAPVLAGFELVDLGAGGQRTALTDGMELTLSDPSGGNYGIVAAIAEGETVGSVAFVLDEPGEDPDVTGTESEAPWSLYGDGGEHAIAGAPFRLGRYTLTATAYTEKDLGGAVLGTLGVEFTVASVDIDGAAVTGFELVDTKSNERVATLGEGATVELAEPSKQRWGILATVTGNAVMSVGLELLGPGANDTAAKTENYEPWSLTGDTNGEPHGRALPPGSYTLTATAWSEKDLGGTPLATLGVGFTVVGPPALSVADASAEESDGRIAFEVTLDRAASGEVTVDWATADGSATAGEDYTAGSGTLSFQPGETSKTIAVALLDDAVDDGGETFRLLLSNPTGAVIADGEAVGTIENSDPMPSAWLVRFGRTVGSQVVDAVTARFEAPGASHVTLGGQRLSLDGEAGDGAQGAGPVVCA